jgi:hypothetical protein
MPTPEESAVQILSILAAKKTRPGESHHVGPINFLFIKRPGNRSEDFLQGMEYALEHEWLDQSSLTITLLEGGAKVIEERGL